MFPLVRYWLLWISHGETQAGKLQWCTENLWICRFDTPGLQAVPKVTFDTAALSRASEGRLEPY